MSGTGTKTGLKARGRAFINKHILKQGTAAAVPVMPVVAAAPVRPNTPTPIKAATTQAAVSETASAGPAIVPPVTVPSIAPDRLGNDSAEGSWSSDGLGAVSGEKDDDAPLPTAPTVDASLDGDSSSESEAALDDVAAPVASMPVQPPKRPAAEAPSISEKYVPPAPAPEQPIMVAKPVGPEYAREFNERGWRVAAGGSDESRAKNDEVTRLYEEFTQTYNELTVGPDGAFLQRGNHPEEPKLGFTMDAAGRTVGFKEGLREQDGNQGLNSHHSSVLGGDALIGDDGNPVLDAHGKPVMVARPAAVAGSMTFQAGRLTEISNDSGHYKPTVDRLVQAIEHLTKAGAFFADELYDAAGVELDEDSAPAKLYRAIQPRVAEAESKKAEISKLAAEVQAAESEGDSFRAENIAMELGILEPQLQALIEDITQAKDALQRLGIAPGNRTSGAKASYVDTTPEWTDDQIKAAQAKSRDDKKRRAETGEAEPDFSYKTQKQKTGLEIKDFQKEGMEVQAFARTGGGRKVQAARKAGVLQNMKPLTTDERQRVEKLQQKAREGAELSADETAEMASYIRRAKLSATISAINTDKAGLNAEDAAEALSNLKPLAKDEEARLKELQDRRGDNASLSAEEEAERTSLFRRAQIARSRAEPTQEEVQSLLDRLGFEEDDDSEDESEDASEDESEEKKAARKAEHDRQWEKAKQGDADTDPAVMAEYQAHLAAVTANQAKVEADEERRRQMIKAERGDPDTDPEIMAEYQEELAQKAALAEEKAAAAERQKAADVGTNYDLG